MRSTWRAGTSAVTTENDLTCVLHSALRSGNGRDMHGSSTPKNSAKSPSWASVVSTIEGLAEQERIETMYYVVAILVAGLWAAFLLPSFFDHRSGAPKATTRSFARAQQVLAQVSSAQPDSDTYVRHHAQDRRQRILAGLAAAALLTLIGATLTGSVAWLGLTIAVDIAIATYVTVLLYMKQQSLLPTATVVPIASAQPSLAAGFSELPVHVEESKTVRVIAG